MEDDIFIADSKLKKYYYFLPLPHRPRVATSVAETRLTTKDVALSSEATIRL